MNKKVLKTILILLIIPLIISIIVSLYSLNGGNAPKNNFNSLDGVNYDDINYSRLELIKKSEPYIYISVFTLVAIGFGTWAYTKKKGEF